MATCLKMSPSRAIIPLLFIIFIDSLGYMIAIPIFLRLLLDPHISLIPADTSISVRNILFSFSIAIGPFGYMIGAPIMGTWSDLWGRKRTLIVSLLMCSIGFLLPIFGIWQQSLPLIIVGRFIGGLASSSQSIAQSAIGDISKGKQKAWYFSLVAFAMTLSLLIGPTMGSYLSDPQLVSWFSLTTPFTATLILLAVATILTYYYYHDYYISERESVLRLNNLIIATKTALAPGKIRTLFIIFFLYELGWSLYYQDIGLYLSEAHHYTVTAVSQFMAYSGIWMALGLTLIYHYLIRQYSLRFILACSLACCALSFSACALWASDTMQWIAIIPGAIAVGTTYPTLMALISDSVSHKKQGWVLGFAAAAFSAPWGISALLEGALTNIHVALPLYVAAASLITAYGLCWQQRATIKDVSFST